MVFLPAWARASGSALKALLFGPQGPGPDWFWTGLTFAAICAILLGPKTIYTAVERTVTLLVVIIVLGLILVAVRVGTLEHVAEMARGLFNFGHIELDAEFPFHRFFSAVVYAGVGGFGNLFYIYYLRDKQIGMGGRFPKLMSPLRSKAKGGEQTGYIFTETPHNRRHFKKWFRYVVLDQTLYFWLLNTFTIMAIYTPLTLYLNLRRLPPAARPGWLNICMVGLASLVYGGFALYCIWNEVVGLFF